MSSLEESLKKVNILFAEYYKQEVAEYGKALAQGKEVRSPVVWAAVGGTEFKPDGLLNIFAGKTVISNNIECPPDNGIQALSKIPLAHYDMQEMLNSEQSMSNIMGKLKGAMNLPVVMLDHIPADTEMAFSQCIKNYEQSGVHLPRKPEGKLVRR